MAKSTSRIYKKTKKEEINYSRIQFFKYFILSHNLSQKDVANILGITPPAIAASFASDDIKFSYIKKIVNYLGYEINIWLTKENSEIEDSCSRPEISPCYMASQRRLENLSFLYYAMNRYGFSAISLAKACGMSQGALYYSFREDDIMFATIYDIAKAMECSIVISIEQKEPQLSTEQALQKLSERRVVTEMHNKDVQPLD